MTLNYDKTKENPYLLQGKNARHTADNDKRQAHLTSETALAYVSQFHMILHGKLHIDVITAKVSPGAEPTPSRQDMYHRCGTRT